MLNHLAATLFTMLVVVLVYYYLFRKEVESHAIVRFRAKDRVRVTALTTELQLKFRGIRTLTRNQRSGTVSVYGTVVSQIRDSHVIVNVRGHVIDVPIECIRTPK